MQQKMNPAMSPATSPAIPQIDDLIVCFVDDRRISPFEDSAYLTFSSDERVDLMCYLNKKLASFTVLDGLDTANVEELTHLIDSVNDFREDEVVPSFDRELILQNAPEKNNEAFIAPKAVE